MQKYIHNLMQTHTQKYICTFMQCKHRFTYKISHTHTLAYAHKWTMHAYLCPQDKYNMRAAHTLVDFGIVTTLSWPTRRVAQSESMGLSVPLFLSSSHSWP